MRISAMVFSVSTHLNGLGREKECRGLHRDIKSIVMNTLHWYGSHRFLCSTSWIILGCPQNITPRCHWALCRMQPPLEWVTARRRIRCGNVQLSSFTGIIGVIYKCAWVEQLSHKLHNRRVIKGSKRTGHQFQLAKEMIPAIGKCPTLVIDD